MGVGRSINYKSKRMNECQNTKLTIENKELKRRMVEWTTLHKECQELKKKEEAWNETEQVSEGIHRL